MSWLQEPGTPVRTGKIGRDLVESRLFRDAEICAAAKRGESPNAIAARMRISIKTVRAAIDAAGIERRRNYSRDHAVEMRVLEMYGRDNATLPEIGRALGMYSATARGILQRYKVFSTVDGRADRIPMRSFRRVRATRAAREIIDGDAWLAKPMRCRKALVDLVAAYQRQGQRAAGHLTEGRAA